MQLDGKLARRASRYLLTGVVTVVPLWITWLVFRFVFGQLSEFGMPWVRVFSRAVYTYAPFLTRWVEEPWFQSLLAVLVTLGGLYFLGWLVSRVVGRRILLMFDNLMNRIPLVQTIYGGTKKMLAALQRKPNGTQRVVLIPFPTPEMKTVGFVTRIIHDRDTGRQLAAVYVPTTPNPTSGYLEIVPLEHVVSTDWTVDEAMTFIISGGAVAPESLRFGRRSGDQPTIK